MKMQTRKTPFDLSTIRHYTDSRHRLIAIVPLHDGRGEAIILASDLAALIERGRGPHWYYSGDGDGRFYVAARNPLADGLTTLARLILQAPKGVRISYADGNRMNLLPENLVLTKALQGKERAGTDFSERDVGGVL